MLRHLVGLAKARGYDHSVTNMFMRMEGLLFGSISVSQFIEETRLDIGHVIRDAAVVDWLGALYGTALRSHKTT